MESLTKELIQELLASDQSTCLSLYMPTHSKHPENLQDVIRFKNLVKQMEKSLLLKYSASEVQKFLEPFDELSNDETIWNHTTKGLAVFSATDYFKVIGLQETVDELAIVADSFHTKPLRQYLQSVDRFHLLGLSLHEFKLFLGNRHSLVEVELSEDTPKMIEEALKDDSTERNGNMASQTGIGGENTGTQPSFGNKKDDNAEGYFRIVANYINDNFSKPTGLPLILAALPEHHNLFQKVSKNPLLLAKGVAINPASVSPDKLKDMAWEIMEPEYLLKLDHMADRYRQAKANGKGSDDIKQVAAAAVEGRVDTLIIEANRIIAMRITNLVTGNTQKKDLLDPKVDDLLDDMGELVAKMGGQVMVLPIEKMPSETGLAAIYRY